MSFIHFSKDQLNDPEFSLNKEIILVNELGTYSSSSLLNCNTRRQHGLLVTSPKTKDDNKYVLLSSLDETVWHQGKKQQLATHKYPDVYYPEGFKHLEDFTYKYIPVWISRIKDIVLKKEILLMKADERILIRYTVLESGTIFSLQLDPFLVYRNILTVSKANTFVNEKIKKVENGIKIKMYPGYSDLCLQLSMAAEFIDAPDWNYNNEFYNECEKGFEHLEDLYTPGYFVTRLKKGDQIVFSAGTTELNPRELNKIFDTELNGHIKLYNFSNCLENAASQHIIENKNETEIIGAYIGSKEWKRETFISLPGLTLCTGRPEICEVVLNSMLNEQESNFFSNENYADNAILNTSDASLWFFWALQQYAVQTNTISEIWKKYGSKIKLILENYKEGNVHNICMLENGLINESESEKVIELSAATFYAGQTIKRNGLMVDLNALWYNAICFAIEAAAYSNDKEFITEWELVPIQIESSFKETFWNSEKGYLADYVNENTIDWSLRPNQIFAVSLPYSPVNDELKEAIFERMKEKLLTPRGLRTLSRDDKNYTGKYSCNQTNRGIDYRQGTVWPWLMGHFVEAYFKIDNEKAMSFAQSVYENFAPAVLEYGIGTIAEIYDGDEPHTARGAVSYAPSVAELLRIRSMISAKHKEELKKVNSLESLQIF